jgi:hypothetical protein
MRIPRRMLATVPPHPARTHVLEVTRDRDAPVPARAASASRRTTVSPGLHATLTKLSRMNENPCKFSMMRHMR